MTIIQPNDDWLRGDFKAWDVAHDGSLTTVYAYLGEVLGPATHSRRSFGDGFAVTVRRHKEGFTYVPHRLDSPKPGIRIKKGNEVKELIFTFYRDIFLSWASVKLAMSAEMDKAWNDPTKLLENQDWYQQVYGDKE